MIIKCLKGLGVDVSKIHNQVAKELMYLHYNCSQKLKEKKLLAKKMKLEQKKQKEGEWYPLFLVVTFVGVTHRG